MKGVCVAYGSIVFIYKNRKHVCFYDEWVWTVTVTWYCHSTWMNHDIPFKLTNL